MQLHEFESIMKDDDIGGVKLSEPGCSVSKGLAIIQKYMPLHGISGAGHDVVYSVTARELVDAGITEDDAKELRMLNWMLQRGDDLASFV